MKFLLILPLLFIQTALADQCEKAKVKLEEAGATINKALEEEARSRVTGEPYLDPHTAHRVYREVFNDVIRYCQGCKEAHTALMTARAASEKAWDDWIKFMKEYDGIFPMVDMLMGNKNRNAFEKAGTDLSKAHDSFRKHCWK